jgi:hypothetical protein
MSDDANDDAVTGGAREETKAEKKARKRAEKAQELAEDAHRPLDSWERYRALCDALKEANDLVDLADHKARFALVIMGALNAVLFIVATRGQFASAVPPAVQAWLGAGLVIYALVAAYFFLQAIEALRPRRFETRQPVSGGAGEDTPPGLRFYADVLVRDPAAYAAAWQGVNIGQLNAEVARQIYAVSRINDAKYAALRRLYSGLRAMTLAGAAFLVIAAFFILRG